MALSDHEFEQFLQKVTDISNRWQTVMEWHFHNRNWLRIGRIARRLSVINHFAAEQIEIRKEMKERGLV